jgi:hypothetical protein
MLESVLPDWPMELPEELPDCPIELPEELPDWLLEPDCVPFCAISDIDVVSIRANASANIFFISILILEVFNSLAGFLRSQLEPFSRRGVAPRLIVFTVFRQPYSTRRSAL